MVHFLGLGPRFLGGVLEVPVYHMRGGTSTGIVLYEEHLPAARDLREELIRRIMGVPLSGAVPGDRQITGLGRGIPQSCKVFIVGPSQREDADIDSTLAQLAPGKAEIDWSVNCGNMSAALPLYAGEVGLVSLSPGRNRVRIHNTNTGVITHALLEAPQPGQVPEAGTRIPGVMGEWPGVQLALLDPGGAKTGAVLPTGAVRDSVDGIEVSCVDVAVPMVIARAGDLGKQASESPEALDADRDFGERIRRIWVEAGQRMGLCNADGSPMTPEQLAASETIPKFCIVAPPSKIEADAGNHVRVRYFTPQAGHKSMAVTGGACLAAACLIPGTVAHEVSRSAGELGELGEREDEHVVRMANPAGSLKATITGAFVDGQVVIPSAAYERSTQILLRGHTPIYNASAELLAAYADLARVA